MKWSITPAGVGVFSAKGIDPSVAFDPIEAVLQADDPRGAADQFAERAGWKPIAGLNIRGGYDTGSTLGVTKEERLRCLAGAWFRWEHILLFDDDTIAVVQPHEAFVAGKFA